MAKTTKKSSKNKKSQNPLISKIKAARKSSLENSAKPLNKDEALRPESRVAKVVNRVTKKASEVGEKEVTTPTPTDGVLGRRVDPFKPVKWFFRYLKESYQELRKVTWPDRRSAWKLTGTVFLFSVIMALFLFGIDSVFSKMFEYAFLK
jgi:preprotein translocase subunit SecE